MDLEMIKATIAYQWLKEWEKTFSSKPQADLPEWVEAGLKHCATEAAANVLIASFVVMQQLDKGECLTRSQAET